MDITPEGPKTNAVSSMSNTIITIKDVQIAIEHGTLAHKNLLPRIFTIFGYRRYCQQLVSHLLLLTSPPLVFYHQ